MITINLTTAEAYALIDYLWGEESDTAALSAANEKLIAAVHSDSQADRVDA
jgi:hypothetical protein